MFSQVYTDARNVLFESNKIKRKQKIELLKNSYLVAYEAFKKKLYKKVFTSDDTNEYLTATRIVEFIKKVTSFNTELTDEFFNHFIPNKKDMDLKQIIVEYYRCYEIKTLPAKKNIVKNKKTLDKKSKNIGKDTEALLIKELETGESAVISSLVNEISLLPISEIKLVLSEMAVQGNIHIAEVCALILDDKYEKATKIDSEKNDD